MGGMRFMIPLSFVVTILGVYSAESRANTADFNALTAGTRYSPGSMFSNGGLDFDVLAGRPLISAVGTIPPNPSFNGNYLNQTSNVEVAINLPTGASQIQFDCFSNTSNALRINGGTITFLHIPGTMNGVTVTKSGARVTAAGGIESFSFIGTEFMVDNLVADLTASLAGDYDNNLVVDAADYLWWRKNTNNPSGYNSWRTNFGASSSGGGSSLGGEVPEPPALALVGIVLVAMGQCRRGERVAHSRTPRK
jgi:hypothetical protein